MTFTQIIAREFRAHATFPIIGTLDVTFPEDEVIQVDVDGMTFAMTCGSDDDRFHFECHDRRRTGRRPARNLFSIQHRTFFGSIRHWQTCCP
jgi:hypothetical protein